MKALFYPLKDALKADGVPFEILYGPTTVPPKVGASRIQMLRDTGAGDTLGPARSQRPITRVVGLRAIGFIVRIHATATIASATRLDHEEIADRIVEQVRAKLFRVVRAANTVWHVTRAGFVDDATTDAWNGAVYELRFAVDTSDQDITWVGDGPGTFTMSADTTQTALSATGAGHDDAIPSATTRIEP